MKEDDGRQVTCANSLLDGTISTIKKVILDKFFIQEDHKHPYDLKVISMFLDDDKLREALTYLKLVYTPTNYLKGRDFTRSRRSRATNVAITSTLSGKTIVECYSFLYEGGDKNGGKRGL